MSGTISLTAAQALEAFTRGSAFVNHDEADSGALAEAFRADLAIVDRDLADGFAGARVVLTMAGGRVVHDVAPD